MTDHPDFMQQAVNSAIEGIQNKDGGPFGACIVKDQKLIAVSHNTVLKDKDPTCHAEMNVIREAAKKLRTHVLSGCTLYTTAEPCPMCLAAIYWARIDRFIVGVPKDCAASYGFDDAFFYEQILLPEDQRQIPSKKGILASECEKVFKQWKEIEGVLY